MLVCHGDEDPGWGEERAPPKAADGAPLAATDVAFRLVLFFASPPPPD